MLVNNAGVMPNGGFLEMDDATTRMTVEVNLFGIVHGMRLALPGMLERGHGHIANVASLAGKFPVKGLAIYNASKFAVVALAAASAVTPEPVLNLIRRAIRDDRALHADSPDRLDYRQKLNQQKS